MPRFRVLSGAEVCRILDEHGFRQVRQRGSHIIMQRALPGTTITIPAPNHREPDRGTLGGIVRRSGLPTQPFEVE